MGQVKFFLFLSLLLTVTAGTAHALDGDVTLLYPDDSAWTNETNAEIGFGFMLIGDKADADCTLNVNGNFYGPYLSENESGSEIFADDDFLEGANSWNITCENGTLLASETRTLNADRTAPSVTATWPDSGYSTTPGTVDFTFSYTDSYSGSADCRLETNDTESDSGTFNNDTSSSFGVSLDSGSYEWFIACTDSSGNTGVTAKRTLEIGTTAVFSADITSPENTTYEPGDIDLTFTTSESADWVGYSLDGADNVTITGSDIVNVDEGAHTIVLYANDSSGSMASDTVHFTAETEESTSSNDIDFVSPSEETYDRNYLTVNITTDDDVYWCGLSLDGGENKSMSNVSLTSWYYSLTSLGEGSHDVEVWCNDSEGWITESETFRVVISGFNINVVSPKSETYWGTDSFDVLVELNIDAFMCEFHLDSEGPALLKNYNSRAWYYNMSDVGSGTHTLIVRCNDSAGYYNSTTVPFEIDARECESNTIGVCTGSQECISNECKDIECSGCAYAEDHMCKLHECCTDDECIGVQKCVSNKCESVDCECGTIQNHTCIEYECCSNFDCDANEECNAETHSCTKMSLNLIVPESVNAGQEFTVSLYDSDYAPMEGAKIKVEYMSGVTESLTTNEQGKVMLVAKESGPVSIIADVAGYDRVTVIRDVVPGVDLTAVIIFVVLLLGGVSGFFYWKQLPPLSLRKIVKGQEVVLKVKNRSGEYIDSALILDSVPSGAFISCGLMPRVEQYGNEAHLSWFASLNAGEEITISYQAVQTSDKFMVRAGDDEYQSGSDILDIMQMLIEKLRGGAKVHAPAEDAPQSPPAQQF